MIGSGGGTLDKQGFRSANLNICSACAKLTNPSSSHSSFKHPSTNRYIYLHFLGVVNSSLYSFSAYVMNIMSSLQMVGQPLQCLLQRSHQSLSLTLCILAVHVFSQFMQLQPSPHSFSLFCSHTAVFHIQLCSYSLLQKRDGYFNTECFTSVACMCSHSFM